MKEHERLLFMSGKALKDMIKNAWENAAEEYADCEYTPVTEAPPTQDRADVKKKLDNMRRYISMEPKVPVSSRLDAWIAYLDRFLDFSESTFRTQEYDQTLKEAYAAHLELYKLQQAYRRADVAITAYRQSRKIRDLLVDICQFADSIEADASAEITALKGYNNYMFFLKGMIEKMQKKYDEVDCDAPKISDERSMLLFFIREECREDPYIKDLPDIYNRLMQVKQSGNVDAHLMGDADLAIELLRNRRDVQYLQAAMANMTARKHKMQTAIQEGEALYKALCEMFPGAFFDALNPDEDACIFADRDGAWIKNYYGEIKRKIEEKLLNRF